MPLSEFFEGSSEDGLTQHNGIIVMRLHNSVEFSYLVFLEGKPAHERFVFVNETAYEEPIRCSRSKSEKTRMECKADLYSVCDPVLVWLRPGLKVCDKMIRDKGDSKMSGNLLYRTRVVLSPPEEDGWIRCYAEDFGEVKVRKEDQFRFRDFFPNVAYHANVHMEIDVSDLSSLDVEPTASAEYFLDNIIDSPYDHLSCVVTVGVNPMLHTYRASEIQTTLCRMAPWNANLTLTEIAFYEDGDWYQVSDPNPSKRKETLKSRAVIIDEDGRTAFCRRQPDNLILLADVHRKNKFQLGEWVAAHFFYSPICKQWVAVSCGPESEFNEDDRETFFIAIDHHVKATTYFKVIARKRHELVQHARDSDHEELVQHARDLTLDGRATLTAQKGRLVGELRDFGYALGSSPQGRRQLVAANLRKPWFDLVGNADNLPGQSA
ncbi:hypothetical protein AAVH_08935 [Aphelenchoides avenae]|nr:hypothetical protein AAVH_08935 [Aphelenchus avenae]